MRRVKVFLDGARGSRTILLVTALLAAAASVWSIQEIVGRGESLSLRDTAAPPDAAAERRAAKVVTSVVPSTTTTTTTVAPPSTEAPTTAPAATAPPATAPPRAAAPPPTEAPPPPPETAAPSAAPVGGRCLVRLHGKGGSGGGVHQAGDVTVIEPSGNAGGWGGRQWLYFAPSSYSSAAAPIVAAVDDAGCGQVIVNGFSNGGAMAMKLYCRGETFGGRLVGVVVDDPVPDHGADGCARPAGVALTVYWTGALEYPAQPGWNCAEQDWTCEGGTTVGIGAYAANAGVAPRASVHSSHAWYENAPETQAWR